jgi:hypothetical protein
MSNAASSRIAGSPFQESRSRLFSAFPSLCLVRQRYASVNCQLVRRGGAWASWKRGLKASTALVSSPTSRLIRVQGEESSWGLQSIKYSVHTHERDVKLGVWTSGSRMMLGQGLFERDLELLESLKAARFL